MHHRNAYVLLLLTTLFWGGNAVAGKLAVGHVSPMLLTGRAVGFRPCHPSGDREAAPRRGLAGDPEAGSGC